MKNLFVNMCNIQILMNVDKFIPIHFTNLYQTVIKIKRDGIQTGRRYILEAKLLLLDYDVTCFSRSFRYMHNYL